MAWSIYRVYTTAFGINEKWFKSGIPNASVVASWQSPNYEGYEMYPDISKTIHYKLNSLGYRDKEWSEKELSNSIWCVGSSDVFGVGVDSNDIWCKVLEKLLGIQTINLGINGAGWDTVSRLINSGCKMYSPKAIIVMASTNERREFVNENIQTIVLPFLPKNKMPYKNFYEHIDDESNLYNVEKNLEIIKLSCVNKNIKYTIFDIEDRWNLIKKFPAADTMHFNKDVHKQVAEELAKWYHNV